MGLSSWSLDHIAFSWRVIPKAFRIKDPWESWNYQRKPWVWTLGGLVTYDVLFFIHLGSRKIHVAGVTPHPNEAWMVQVARNVTMEAWGFLSPGQYLIHDRDGKYCPDRKSTRLNSSHGYISYAVFCLKKKKKIGTIGG